METGKMVQKIYHCLKISDMPSSERFFARQGDLTSEYLTYFKENQRGMAEKEPLFGRVDIFQIRPKLGCKSGEARKVIAR